MYFLVFKVKGRSNDDVGVARGTEFQALRPGVGFKTGDFVEKNWGGYRRTTLGIVYMFFIYTYYNTGLFIGLRFHVII